MAIKFIKNLNSNLFSPTPIKQGCDYKSILFFEGVFTTVDEYQFNVNINLLETTAAAVNGNTYKLLIKEKPNC
jgi:hypothetical protein